MSSCSGHDAAHDQIFRGTDIDAVRAQVRHVAHRWDMSAADALEIVMAFESAQSTPAGSSS